MTILQRLYERRRELKSDLKDKNLKDALKGKYTKKGDMWEQQKIITQHRLDELDYIIILLKEEGIIKSQ